VGQNSGNFTVNVTLDDAAGANLTQASNPTTGSFKPTSFNLPTYPSLSPAGPYPPPPGRRSMGRHPERLLLAACLAQDRATLARRRNLSLFSRPTSNASEITEGNGTNMPGWCLNFTVQSAVLSIAKSTRACISTGTSEHSTN